MTDYPHIDTHLDALDTFASTTSARHVPAIQWWLKTTRIGVGAADWVAACDRITSLSTAWEKAEMEQGWDHLCATFLLICLEGKLQKRARGVLSLHPKLSDSPKALFSVLEQCAAARDNEIGVCLEIAKVVSSLLPHSALPLATHAHLLEKKLKWREAAALWKSAMTLAPTDAYKLRAGAALAHAGAREEARSLLKSRPAFELSIDEALWWAPAMASSPSKFDRIRVWDFLSDEAQLAAKAKPEARLEMEEIKKLARVALSFAPEVLDEDEFERIRESLHPLADPDIENRIRALEGHSKLSRVSGTDHAERPGNLTLDSLKAQLATPDDHELRPWVVFWIDEISKESPTPVDSTTIFKRWAERTPAPSCGFWSLARYAGAHKQIEWMLIAARRARDTEPLNDDARAVMGLVLESVAERGDYEELRRWLEFAQAHFESA